MTNALETDKQVSPLLRRMILYLHVPVGIIALAGLLLSGWVHVASMRGVDVALTWPNVWLLQYALFPIILLTVIAAAQVTSPKRLSLRDLLTILPWWGLGLLAAALVYSLATFLLVVPASGAGEPLILDGRFFFNDHGIIREVTEDQFHIRRSLSLRLYSSVWLYLYLVAVMGLLCVRHLREKTWS